MLSADGKKVLYKVEKDYFIADAAAGKGDRKARRSSICRTCACASSPPRNGARCFTPRGAWSATCSTATKMNGVDWAAVRAAYGKLLPLVGSRSDLNFLIGEMLGELGNSHTYVSGGDDMPEEQRVPTAFLGADFALDAASGRYRLARIFTGDNTRETYRSPLDRSRGRCACRASICWRSTARS